MRRTIHLIAALVAATSQAATAQSGVIVNGEPVSQETYAREFARFGITVPGPVPDGRYWYDALSGLWGLEGGPATGQLLPGLDLGGRLSADASGGATAVFINGRALHPVEVTYLQQLFGTVVPGRFWMNAQGIGGLEGGPPLFNLVAAAQAQGGGYTHRGLFGSTGSDGNCSYYMHPNGSSVMTGCD